MTPSQIRLPSPTDRTAKRRTETHFATASGKPGRRSLPLRSSQPVSFSSLSATSRKPVCLVAQPSVQTTKLTLRTDLDSLSTFGIKDAYDCRWAGIASVGAGVFWGTILMDCPLCGQQVVGLLLLYSVIVYALRSDKGYSERCIGFTRKTRVDHILLRISSRR